MINSLLIPSKMKQYIYGIALLTITGLLPHFGQSQGLYIGPGVHLVMNDSPSLVLNDAGLTNNGSFDAGRSNILFMGNAATANSFVGGSIPVSFYHIIVGKSSNDVELDNNTFVTGSITLNSGNLQLNNYLLDLGSSGSITGERTDSRITGPTGGAIKITALLNAPMAVNPGNIGVELTSPANLGSTVITRAHVEQTYSSGETSIQRNFDIVPENNGGLQATLRFLYLDGEMAGKNKNELTVFSKEEPYNEWRVLGNNGSDPVANWVIKNNIDQLHRFTLAIGSGKANSKPGPSGNIPSLKIYPNPAHDAFALQLISEEEGNGVMYLYDQSGNLLEEKAANWQAGVNTISWNIGKYATGVYYLSIGGPIRNVIEIVRQ